MKWLFLSFKIYIELYLLYHLSAIFGGELTYRTAIKNKDSFTLVPKRIFTLPEIYPIRKMLYYHHLNVSFNYIYLRVNKIPIWKFILNLNLLYRIAFLYITGINWLIVKTVNKLIRRNTTDLKLIIFNECAFHDERILFIKNGIWYSNNWIKLAKTRLELWFNSQLHNESIKNKALKDFENIVNKHNHLEKINTPNIETNWGLLKSNKTAGLHRISKDIHKDKTKLAWFTDLQKAKNNNYYEEKIVINKVHLEKKTIILEKEINDVIIKSKPGTLTGKQIIMDAAKHGYNASLIKDNLLESIFDYKQYCDELDAFANEYLIDANTIQDIKSIISLEIIDKEVK